MRFGVEPGNPLFNYVAQSDENLNSKILPVIQHATIEDDSVTAEELVEFAFDIAKLSREDLTDSDYKLALRYADNRLR